MRFKVGVVIGFGIGYYFGAKAGRHRYVQLHDWLHGAAADKAKAVVDLGIERARDLVDRGEDAQDHDRNVVIDLGAGGFSAAGGYSPSR